MRKLKSQTSAALQRKIDRSRPSWSKDLDDREYAWVLHYINCFRAKDAAIAAGAPPRSAHNYGCEVRQRPRVRLAINLALKEAMPEVKLTIAERLHAIVTTDIAEIVEWRRRKIQTNAGAVDAAGKPAKPKYRNDLGVEVVESHKLTPQQRAAVKGIRRRVGAHGESVEVVMHDPIAAAERLAALLELTTPIEETRGGSVTFVIEAPDGAVLRDSGRVQTIDHDAVDAAISEGDDSRSSEERPPGAPALIIETP